MKKHLFPHIFQVLSKGRFPRPNFDSLFRLGFCIIIFFLVAFGIKMVLGWTGPPASPPTCPFGSTGCDAPINVGSSAQEKLGPLTLRDNFIMTLTTTNKGISIMTSDGNNTHIRFWEGIFERGRLQFSGVDNSLRLQVNNGPLTFFTEVINERLRITPSGNVGIGTTDPGTYKLKVAGTISAGGNQIKEVAVPSDVSDVATMGWVLGEVGEKYIVTTRGATSGTTAGGAFPLAFCYPGGTVVATSTYSTIGGVEGGFGYFNDWTETLCTQ